MVIEVEGKSSVSTRLSSTVEHDQVSTHVSSQSALGGGPSTAGAANAIATPAHRSTAQLWAVVAIATDSFDKLERSDDAWSLTTKFGKPR